jgi:predicted flap endonuclease-1-like 5' DNA nuclease
VSAGNSQQTGNDLPRGIGQPATRALLAVGVSRLDQLCAWRVADLAQLHGVGPKAISVLGRAMTEAGLQFAG